MLHRDPGERIGIEVVQPPDRSAAAAVGSRESGAIGAERDPIVGRIRTECHTRCEPAVHQRGNGEPCKSHRTCLKEPVTAVELISNGSAVPPLATGRTETVKIRSCSPANVIAEPVTW